MVFLLFQFKIIYRFTNVARAKSETLVNMLINKKIKSCSAKRRRQ